jgi:serine/threonine protein kinase
VFFDKRLAPFAIQGSLAHAEMLAAQGIISEQDRAEIERGMAQIKGEIDAGSFEWLLDLEDVHLNIEKRLTELVGDAGQRLHTGPLTSGEARDLFASLAEALSVAHAAHIFHRDIKPSNIMIRPDGTPVLLDFGIATASDPADQTTTAVGTPTYMAPELFDAGPIDPAKADLYSMGVVLYECLTGSRPFAEGDSKRHSSERVATTVAAKLRTEQLDPGEGVEAGLREIVRRLSRRDPAQRIASMEEAARLLRDEPRLPSIGSMGPDAIARALPPKAPAAAPPAAPAPPAAQAEDGAVLRRWIVGGVLVALGLSILVGGAAWLWVMSL